MYYYCTQSKLQARIVERAAASRPYTTGPTRAADIRLIRRGVEEVAPAAAAPTGRGSGDVTALNALDRAEQRVRAHGPSDPALREARLRHDDKARDQVARARPTRAQQLAPEGLAERSGLIYCTESRVLRGGVYRAKVSCVCVIGTC